MSREKNIFHKLVKDENHITELFCNLLQFDSFRGLFIGIIRSKTNLQKFSFEYRDIYSQYKLVDNGQVDIAIINSADCILLTEIKWFTNAELTGNQPDGYINYMIDNEYNSKVLLFLIPRYYSHRTELDFRIEKMKFKMVKKCIQYNVIFWEEIYDELKKYNRSENKKVFDDFMNLIQDHIINEIKFDKEDFNMMFNNKKFPGLLNKMINLLANIEKKLQDEYSFETKESETWYNAGFYINKNSEEKFWFGIWYGPWEETGNPFYITYDNEKNYKINTKLEKIFKEKIDYYEEGGDCYYYCLKKEDFDDSDNIDEQKNVDKIAKFLKEIIDAFYK